ncbi:MAG: 2-keto-4-pentenoate hydratase, partial [Candidatus Binatia bacterium]
MPDIEALAALLDDAAQRGTAVPQLSATTPLSLADAYAIQHANVGRRLARGERLVGIKMGLTSRAKALQMGVSDLIFGRLTDRMIIEDGGALDCGRYAHPRVEPELAFLLKAPLSGTVTPLQALAAVEAIAPAMEVIDSRYENFRFSLTDVVADNSSSAGFVVGPWHRPDIDFSNLGMVMSFDGRPVQIGSSAAIMGHPLRSLVTAARMVAA